ncbi:MAG: hypothetical protein ACRCUE_18115 [Bosea sp. (in: a-proteobacteria)]
MKKILISKRVVHLGGYDPMTPEKVFVRFNRELARSAVCWGVSASTRDFRAETERATWVSELHGPGWKVVAEHELLRWDDVIEAHRSGSTLSRWLGGIVSFADFVVHGALWRYLMTAWRYAAFFIYPFAALIVVFVLGMIAADLAMTALGAAPLLVTLTSIAAGFTASFLMVRRGHVGHLLDDWDFARRLIRTPDAVISARLRNAAGRLAAVPAEIDVVVVGHSLGAVLAAELLDRIIAQPGHSRGFRFVALGSSVLKLALHSGADMLRHQLSRINGSGRISWIEFQSLSDVMNFYKTDPVKLLKLEGPSPLVRQVRFSRMLQSTYYSKVKRNFFRLHCQFISGNDRRAPYDYIMMTCGPFPVEHLARSADGAMRWLDETGGLTPLGRANVATPAVKDLSTRP